MLFDPSTLSDTDRADMLSEIVFGPVVFDRALTTEEIEAVEACLTRIIGNNGVSELDLLAEFDRVEWIAGEPVHEALLAEVRKRNLNF